MDIISTILAALLVSLITWFVKLIVEGKKISKWKKEETKNKLMKLGLTRDEEYKYIKSPNFIATHGQYEGPHENDEVIVSENRFPLVDKLLKAFSKKDSIEKKRYAILGGSGMGKTTFAASFVINYYKQGTLNKPKYPLYVFYLGNPSVLDEIQQINEDESILLLDALDENVEATRNLGAFMEKLEMITNNFRHVIITCRTQFFSDKNSEPHHSSVVQNNPNKQALQYEVIYISPFSLEETESFLSFKFKIPSKEYTKAHQLVEKSENLMARPMVLSFIDDLIFLADNKKITNVEIYKAIIDGWFDRECRNHADITIPELYSFSKKVSLYIFKKWREASVPYISASEYETFLRDNGYDSSPYSFKDRSLLNRRSDGSIKFAHRSFWEFFIALSSFENPSKWIAPEGLEIAVLFSKELYGLYLNNCSFSNICNPFPEYIEKYDITDPSINELFAKCNNIIDYKNISEKKKNTLLFRAIYSLWEVVILKYPNTTSHFVMLMATLSEGIEKTKDIDPIRNAKLRSYAQNLAEIISEALITKIIIEIQSCFLKTNTDEIMKVISSSEKCISMIRDEMISSANYLLNSNDTSPNNYFMKWDPIIPSSNHPNVYVMPYIIGQSDELIDSVLANRYINIGVGLSSKLSLLKLIEFMKQRKNGINSIYINWEADNIDEYIELIIYLSNNLNIRPKFINIKISIDNTYVYYEINDSSILYNEEQVRKTLNVMLKTKN